MVHVQYSVLCTHPSHPISRGRKTTRTHATNKHARELVVVCEVNEGRRVRTLQVGHLIDGGGYKMAALLLKNGTVVKCDVIAINTQVCAVSAGSLVVRRGAVMKPT